MRPNSYYENLNFIKGKLKGVGYISTIYFCDKAKKKKQHTNLNISNNTNKYDRQKQ